MMSEQSEASPWKNPASWSRFVLVVLYLLIFALIAGPLAILLGLAQALFAIFAGADNRNLRGLAGALAEYIRELLLFASWNREQKPFPFSEFPDFPAAEQPAAPAAESDEAPAAAESDEAGQDAAGKAADAPARRNARGKTAPDKDAAEG